MRRRDILKAASATLPAGLPSLLCRPLRARAGESEPVDVELVLAVDVSRSMDPTEMEAQFRGYAEAFRAPDLARGITAGPLGAIACTLFVWSDGDDQRLLIPWTRIDGDRAARAFADAIDDMPREGGLYTSISAAIDFAVGLFGTGGFEGTRRVVDISGDGENNNHKPGRRLHLAREEAIERGVVLNGLAILDSSFGADAAVARSHRRRSSLDEYYRDEVIGGAGCFVVAAQGVDAFAPAVRRKLIREIALSPPAGPVIDRVACA